MNASWGVISQRTVLLCATNCLTLRRHFCAFSYAVSLPCAPGSTIQTSVCCAVDGVMLDSPPAKWRLLPPASSTATLWNPE